MAKSCLHLSVLQKYKCYTNSAQKSSADLDAPVRVMNVQTIRTPKHPSGRPSQTCWFGSPSKLKMMTFLSRPNLSELELCVNGSK